VKKFGFSFLMTFMVLSQANDLVEEIRKSGDIKEQKLAARFVTGKISKKTFEDEIRMYRDQKKRELKYHALEKLKEEAGTCDANKLSDAFQEYANKFSESKNSYKVLQAVFEGIACKCKEQEKIKEIVSVPQKFGYSVKKNSEFTLIPAIQNNNLELTKYLVEKNIPIDYTFVVERGNSIGSAVKFSSPLHEASKQGNLGIIKLLCKTNPSLLYKKPKLPWWKIVSRVAYFLNTLDEPGFPIEVAANDDARALLDHFMNDSRGRRYEVFINAAKNRQWKTVRWYIEHGYPINTLDPNSNNVCHYLVDSFKYESKNDQELLEIAEELNSKSINLDQKNREEITPREKMFQLKKKYCGENLKGLVNEEKLAKYQESSACYRIKQFIKIFQNKMNR